MHANGEYWVDRRKILTVLSAAGLSSMTGCVTRWPTREVFWIVGYNDMEELLTGLVRMPAHHDLPYQFELDLPATKAAPAALLAGRSILAPMGAEMECLEQFAFREKWGGLPIGFRVAHASLSPAALSSPAGILVNQANPLRAISLKAVRKLFAGSYDAAVRPIWGDLGLDGVWRERPVVLTGLDESTAIGKFMLRQFAAERFAAILERQFQSRDVAASVAANELAIGIGNLNHAVGDVRALQVVDDAGVGHKPTAEGIASGRYPFDRFLRIYARRNGAGRLDPVASRFLDLALSEKGQASIAGGSLGYIPLNAAERAEERAKLEIASTGQSSEVVLTGSAPTILKSLATRWQGQLASHERPIHMRLDDTFGPPLGKKDPGLAEFLIGKREFAFLTREIDEDDLRTFRDHHGQAPLIIPVADGSWNRFGHVDAVTIIVHERNPIISISYCQIRGVFFPSLEQECDVSSWGDLGVRALAEQPVRVAGSKEWHPHESAKALTIRRQVTDELPPAGKWRTVSGATDSRHVVDQVAADPLSIGFTAVGHLRPGVRMVPIMPQNDGPAVLPTELTIREGRYRFARTVDLVIARDGAGLPDPSARRLAKALLSVEGQATIASEGTFLPLPKNRLAASLAMLEGGSRSLACKS